MTASTNFSRFPSLQILARYCFICKLYRSLSKSSFNVGSRESMHYKKNSRLREHVTGYTKICKISFDRFLPNEYSFIIKISSHLIHNYSQGWILVTCSQKRSLLVPHFSDDFLWYPLPSKPRWFFYDIESIWSLIRRLGSHHRHTYCIRPPRREDGLHKRAGRNTGGEADERGVHEVKPTEVCT